MPFGFKHQCAQSKETMYQPLDPKGSGSSPWMRWVVTLLYIGLAVGVLVVYAGATPKRPWTALSDANSLITPRLYFYGIEFVVLGLLAYYVLFMWRNQTDRHVHFLQPALGFAFVLDLTAWILWGYSEFIGAAVVTGLAAVTLIYAAKVFYSATASGYGWDIQAVPNMSSYVATSLPLSTYAGWLVFQFVVLVNAAFSKDNNTSFVGGATSGPVAILLVILPIFWFYIMSAHDFHAAAIVWLALIPTYHASLDVQNKYTNVVAALFFGYLGFAIFALFKRFMGYTRKFYICSDVCLDGPASTQ